MYCLKTQQTQLSVKSSQGSYSFQQNNSCRVAISFGWTAPQLFKGKSVTRRCWKDSYGQQFVKRWQRGITTYIALDKGWRQGGQQIGTITLTCCPYKERLSEMPWSDVAAEGFPELSQQEFIQRFFKGDDQQQVWVIRFKFTPLIKESCSTGIVGKLDIERYTEDTCSSPGGNGCSTGLSANAVRTQLSLIGNEQPLWEVGDRVCHRKDPDRLGTVLKPVEGRNLSLIPVEQSDPWKLLTADPDYLLEENGQFTIFSDDEPPEPDDFGSHEAYLKAWAKWELQYPQLAEAVRQAESGLQTIPVEQPAPIETIKVPETQTIKVITLKQPWAWAIFNLGKDVENRIWRDDYRGLLYIHAGKGYDEYGKAWIEEQFNVTVPDNLESGCILGSVELVDISRDSFNSPWSMMHQWHWKLENPTVLKNPIEARGYQKLWDFETLPENLQTQKSPKTRNTKPGRGSRPRQVKCNVKRNSSKGKSANTYWVYKFSFKVDGKYYDRSVSIPKEKVNKTIEMWESKQYSWRDIVEYIGKNPDKIVDKVKQ